MALNLSSSTRPDTSGRRPRRVRSALAVIGTGALLAAGLATAPAAQSATGAACPQAFPIAELSVGQPLSGLTVSAGTEPGRFTGEVLGVLHDGIAPGLDLVLARLQSPALDDAGGVWAGMSGSPVYAADGRLVGAVSYGLGYSPSMIIGLTPAADMLELLDVPESPAVRRALAAAAEADTVALPPRLSRAAVATGAAPGEAAAGLTRLPLPVAVSGATSRKLEQAVVDLPGSGTRTYQTAAAPLSGPAATPVPGGNVAVSLAYGDLTYAAVGTVTAVCGEEVLAFGHPFVYGGRTELGMHGANALLIQPDMYGSFKVANLTAPVGVVDDERIAGVHGRVGAAPAGTMVTSYVEASGRSRTGSSRILYEADMPYLVSWHLYLDQDRVLQAWTKGTGALAWTVRGVRADGSPFTYTRADRYASPWSISDDSAWELYLELDQLKNNSFEDVVVTEVTTRSRLSTSYLVYDLQSVSVRRGGRWAVLGQDETVRLRAGTAKRFKVALTSRVLGARTVVVKLPVPLRAAGRSGEVSITGGDWYGGYDYYEEPAAAGAGVEDFDGLLRSMRRAPHNDTVVAELQLYRDNGKGIRRRVTATTGAVTQGQFYFPARAARR